MNVDLPEPLGPVRPYRRPSENVVVTSSKSTFDPNRMETSLTVIMNLRSHSRPESGRWNPLFYHAPS